MLDVNKAIRELLFQSSSVIVPGLGGFTSTPQSATVDYVQSSVSPPSKKLDFNPNLVINDGVLVHYLQKSNTVTFQEAKEAVERHVESIQQALERREIVDLGQIGRMYKDYEHKIRFMPEGTNFNADSFGLPPVQFTPVVRERRNTAEPAPAENKGVVATAGGYIPPAPFRIPDLTEPVVEDENKAANHWYRGMLPWLVLLAAIVMAATVFLVLRDQNRAAVAELPLDKERTNVKPKPEEQASTSPDTIADAAQAPSEDAPSIVPAPAAQDKEPKVSTEKPAATEQEETPLVTQTGKNKCFIVVHSFGLEENARKLARQLERAGYEKDTRKASTLYRVGVLFTYDEQKQLDEFVKKLAADYKSSPKVFIE